MTPFIKNTFSLLLLFTALMSCTVKKTQAEEIENESLIKTTTVSKNDIKTGADNYTAYLPLLKNKKIGIVTNQTGILSDKTHLVDFLLGKNIAIKTIFAPEHGFRGTADAGEHIVDGKDPKTGLPIISLYGDNKKPKPEELAGIDILVFDLQDVGARFYTYISSLHYIMEACAENNIMLLILDRPNPNITIIDGPVLEKEFTSFVGMHPIPLLHGMTIGEYAQMINGEKWLKNGIQCKLTVIPCLNYNRKMDYSLPIKPSPNLPNDQAVNLYASLCLFEGTNVSVGRGTEKQFQIYGSPYLPKSDFSFTPKPNLGAQNPVYNGIKCYGEDLSTYPRVHQLELKWLIKAYQSTNDKSKFFNSFFTKLAGTKKLQQQIESGISEKEIRESWKEGLRQFKKIRIKYLIY
ncbi:exo-beta-N-acetylmuramidase NamZ domain-containing protein [Flavobacterium sp. LS2P90]|uniref:Exo-beta-N-acetylmuramidase NamZ domain-containing protein n=1 Tax=Flavobacterium xylosi TaxID=3230415 RepID=A0ABW6HVK0_9FLAO